MEPKIAIVVAHPDDEILFAAGPMLRYPNVHVFAASTPVVDPERVVQFYRVCRAMGASAYCSAIPERLDAPLNRLDERIPDLSKFDAIYTHNSVGEYGHQHHKDVHEYLRDKYLGSVMWFFGYGIENGHAVATMELDDDEAKQKMAALRLYDGSRGNNTLAELLLANIFGGSMQRFRTECFLPRHWQP